MAFSRKIFLFAPCFYLLCMTPSYSRTPVPAQKPTFKEVKKETHPNFIPSKPPSKAAKKKVFLHHIIPTIKANTKTFYTKKTNNRDLQRTIDLSHKIFKLQNEARFQDADHIIAKLKNKSLIGHILLHRYMHPTGYQANFEELARWLRAYGDHPSAHRIYKLAQRRQPPDYAYTLPQPYYSTYMNGSLTQYKTTPKIFTPLAYRRTDEQTKRVEALVRNIEQHISDGFPTGALDALQSSDLLQFMSQSEKDLLTTKIARSYLIEGKPNEAFNHASVVADRYGKEMPLSGWISGISAWQQKRYALSTQYFQKTATSDYSNEWTIAASAYWAARAYIKIKNKDKANFWLREAALYPRTFYGILASKKLGITEEFNWEIPLFTRDLRQTLLSHPRGERAYFLVNIGLENLANRELEAIDPRNNPMLKTAMLSLAQQHKLSRFLFKFGHSFKQKDGQYYDSALYPEISSWERNAPHAIDKALTHALIRQESSFKTDAKSATGALGLMQILPSTASYIAKNPTLKESNKWKLTDPSLNIKIGESYVRTLLSRSEINNSLFSLLIAYNAGPGNLKKWQKKIQRSNDPLLFIELIPSAETRAFVERVMTNLWIYRDQLNQDSPSLDAIIQDIWPPYRALDHL